MDPSIAATTVTIFIFLAFVCCCFIGWHRHKRVRVDFHREYDDLLDIQAMISVNTQGIMNGEEAPVNPGNKRQVTEQISLLQDMWHSLDTTNENFVVIATTIRLKILIETYTTLQKRRFKPMNPAATCREILLAIVERARPYSHVLSDLSIYEIDLKAYLDKSQSVSLAKLKEHVDELAIDFRLYYADKKEIVRVAKLQNEIRMLYIDLSKL